ncbi:MAG: dCMP deaminase family protein, partial [Gammaproteobacteria bacterium]|nr:dCMP deaminase family protein [Gammaproteobacteria bacterium]
NKVTSVHDNVRNRGNCKGRQVGAIFVKNNRIISTGYNGTPEGMKNCEDGGCIRCEKHRKDGEYYDKCICVHAEQNAMITAARMGHCIEHSIVYSTLQPCFTCLKLMLQAKVASVCYIEKLYAEGDGGNNSENEQEKERRKDFHEQYKILESRFVTNPFAIELIDLHKGFIEMDSYFKEKLKSK